MSSDRLIDLQRERAARNQALFREVNERIDELNAGLAPDERELLYVCECLDPSCAEQIAMSHQDYRGIRTDPAEFFVAPGHEVLQVEEVVDRQPRWLIVRKLGAGARLATRLAQPPEAEAEAAS